MPNPKQEDPLTPEELKQLRAMLTSEQRVKWLWATIRIWAVWLGAVGLGFAVGWDALVRIVKLASGTGMR